MGDEINNPQAFPVSAGCWPNDESSGNNYGPGMTLRDYFAGKALQGILANPKLPDEIDSMVLAARDCYSWADAMLKARG